MKRLFTHLLIVGSVFATPMFAGCDRTISEEKTVEQKSDGTEVRKEEKTVEKPDGTIEKTEEKSVDR